MIRRSDPPYRRSILAVALASASLSVACGSDLPRSLSGDPARQLAPPPACILRLPARNASTSGERRLDDAQLWGLAFANFDAANGALPKDAMDCRGGHPFTDPAFAGATARRPWPFKVQEGDVAFGAGTNNLRVAWFRTHQYPDGSMGGVLALIRSVDDFAELYSLGTFRGLSDRVKLRISRMGSNLLPSVQNDGCLKRPAGTACETTFTVFRPVRGRLEPAAQFATERIGYATGTEPGVAGRLEYHLVSTATFADDAINVTEQISVKDEQGREVRKAEVKRIFRYEEQSGFEPSEQSLWQTMFLAPAQAPAKGGAPQSASVVRNPGV
jgi:hypothetical protein